MTNNNEGPLIIGTTLLAATSWASAHQAEFSIGASVAAILLSVFGMYNYIRKWKREKK